MHFGKGEGGGGGVAAGYTYILADLADLALCNIRRICYPFHIGIGPDYIIPGFTSAEVKKTSVGVKISEIFNLI